MSSHTGQSPTCPLKLLERLVAQQLTIFLTDNGLLLDLQSAYRAHHSTETAVLKVVADILLALDCSNLALLSLLDLSAAFDKWFASYLSGRTQQRANTDHHVAAITCRAWSPSRIGPSPTC